MVYEMKGHRDSEARKNKMKLVEMRQIFPILIILGFSLFCVPESVEDNEVIPENTVIISYLY
jgi:hypothetical protein